MTKQAYALIDGVWEEIGGPPGPASTVPGPPGPAGASGLAFAQDLTSGTTVVVTHNLGTKDVSTAVYRKSDGLEVDVPFTRTSTNAITLNSSTDLAGHRVVVMSALFTGTPPSLPGRGTAEWTTASLAANASDSGTVLLYKGYRLLGIATDRPARVRLYTTAAKQAADASRAAGTYPTGDHGVILEYFTATGFLSSDLTPTVDGFDGKVSPDGYIAWHVTNMSGSTGTVKTILRVVMTE